MKTNFLQPFLIREQVIKSIRDFFSAKGFHEVYTPVLSQQLPTEPNIYPFMTKWQNGKELFLATSPEAGIKKYLAMGIGNCFTFGRSFRNLEGTSPIHSPDFLMLEWYREKSDYHEIMRDTEDLVRYCAAKIKGSAGKKTDIHNQDLEKKIAGKWPIFSLLDLFSTQAGIDLEKGIEDEKQFFAKARDKGYETKKATFEQIFNQIFLNEIEPKLPQRALFITDFPSRISPLCTPQNDKPYLAQRFEVYLEGMEIGNGNSENTDAISVKKVFDQEKRKRHLNTHVNEDFLNTLEKIKDKQCAGIGLGVDRLTMILTGKSDIREIDPLLI